MGCLHEICFYVNVSGSNGKKVLWVVVDDNVVEEGKEHDDIGLWRLNLFLTKTRKGWLEKDFVSIIIYEC